LAPTERKLVDEVERRVERMRKAEEEKRTVIGQTVYLGTLGLVFVLPVVAGAYLGHWLDGMFEGYSIRWTLSLILLGVFTGILNVYFLLKE
jgi:ATP synthase protein I